MAGMSAERKPPSIRTVWGIAKSPELRLEDEDLYAVVYRETGKESLRKLTAGELSRVIRALQEMKDSARQNAGPEADGPRAETPGRWSQRRKLYKEMRDLGLERSAGERAGPEDVPGGADRMAGAGTMRKADRGPESDPRPGPAEGGGDMREGARRAEYGNKEEAPHTAREG